MPVIWAIAGTPTFANFGVVIVTMFALGATSLHVETTYGSVLSPGRGLSPTCALRTLAFSFTLAAVIAISSCLAVAVVAARSFMVFVFASAPFSSVTLFPSTFSFSFVIVIMCQSALIPVRAIAVENPIVAVSSGHALIGLLVVVAALPNWCRVSAVTPKVISNSFAVSFLYTFILMDINHVAQGMVIFLASVVRIVEFVQGKNLLD